MKNLGMAYKIQKRNMMSRGSSLMEPKSMAASIMKMSKGGMVDAEESDHDADMYEEGLAPEIELMEENQDMPLDHASMEDERLTPEDKDSEWGKKKKGDLISRVMMGLK